MPAGGAQLGAGTQLAKPLNFEDTGASWETFKKTGSIYTWGRQENSPTSTNLITATTANPGEDFLRTIPHVFPVRGTIGQIGWFNGIVNAGGPQFRFGIYDSDPDTLIPANLLFDSGAQTSWPDPAGTPSDQWRKVTADLDVEPGTVLHVAWFYNAAFRTGLQRVWTYAASSVGGILGHLDPNVQQSDGQYRVMGSAYAQSKIVGYRHAQTFGALPSVFPTSSLVTVTDATAYENSVWAQAIATFGFNWTNA